MEIIKLSLIEIDLWQSDRGIEPKLFIILFLQEIKNLFNWSLRFLFILKSKHLSKTGSFKLIYHNSYTYSMIKRERTLYIQNPSKIPMSFQQFSPHIQSTYNFKNFIDSIVGIILGDLIHGLQDLGDIGLKPLVHLLFAFNQNNA